MQPVRHARVGILFEFRTGYSRALGQLEIGEAIARERDYQQHAVVRDPVLLLIQHQVRLLLDLSERSAHFGAVRDGLHGSTLCPEHGMERKPLRGDA